MGERVTKTFVLQYDECPQSLNKGGTGSRRHWSKGYKEKRRWEGIWAMLLMMQRVPHGAFRVTVEGRCEYADNRRRDSENFRSGITKPLADALVKSAILADDTEEFFRFGQLKMISGEEGLSPLTRQRTTLTLEVEYE